MANYKLGPVIGKIGGGVEIVEQQITADGRVSIPAGWGSAYAGFQGTSKGVGFTSPTVLGRQGDAVSNGSVVGGFREMAAGQSLDMKNVSGTLTFIRTN